MLCKLPQNNVSTFTLDFEVHALLLRVFGSPPIHPEHQPRNRRLRRDTIIHIDTNILRTATQLQLLPITTSFLSEPILTSSPGKQYDRNEMSTPHSYVIMYHQLDIES